MEEELFKIKRLITQNDVFEKSKLKCIKYEKAKEIFSLLNIHIRLISDGKGNWANAIYFMDYTQFLLQARIWKNEKFENFFQYNPFIKIENAKKYSFSEINQILLENFCYEILKIILTTNDKIKII